MSRRARVREQLARRTDLGARDPVRREDRPSLRVEEHDRRLLDVERARDGHGDVPRESRQPVGGTAAHLPDQLGEDSPVNVALPVEDHRQEALETAPELGECEHERDDQRDLDEAVLESEARVEEPRDRRDTPDVREHRSDDQDEVEDRAPDDELHVVVTVNVVAEHEARDRRREHDEALEQKARALDRVGPDGVDRDEQRAGSEKDPDHAPVKPCLAWLPCPTCEEDREQRRDHERRHEPVRERSDHAAQLDEARLARTHLHATQDLGKDEHRQVNERDPDAARQAHSRGASRIERRVRLLEPLEEEPAERVEERARDQEQTRIGSGVARDGHPRWQVALEQELEENEREPPHVPEADGGHEDGEEALAAHPPLAAQDHAQEQDVEHRPEEPARDEDDLSEGKLVVHGAILDRRPRRVVTRLRLPGPGKASSSRP